MKRRIRFSQLLIAVLLGITLFGCDRSEPKQEEDTKNKKTIVLGIGTWAGFATGIVGMEKGFFANTNVETKILDNNAARHAAFQSGALNIMISSIDVFAQETAQGIPGKAFLVTDESWGGDGIVAKPEIKKPEDLRGKKVAYARGTPSHYLIHKVLQSNGMSLGDVEHVQVDNPGKAGDVFLSGKVDAAVTWEPFLSQVAESGKGHILVTTKDYPEVTIDLLIASDKLAANEKLLRDFMDGWLKSVDYIKENPEDAAKIMAKGLNLPVEDVQGMMAGLKFADKDRNKYFFSSAQPKDTHVAKLFNEAGAYWKSVDIVEKPVDGATRVSPLACRYFNQN